MPRTIPEAVHELCLSLPDTEVVSRHGAPNFKVKGKTFAMYVLNHHGDGRVALWLHSPPGVQELYTGFDPDSYFVPPYVGVKGWLGMELNRNLDWNEIQARVREAWEHVSPSSPAVPLDELPVVHPPEIGMRPEDINPWLGARAQAILARFETHCMSLPETVREEGAGHPVWKAGRKPFARAAHQDGRLKLQFRVGVEQQALYNDDPRYSIPPYYGASGWIDLDVDDAVHWEEVNSLLDCSYRQVALKRMLKALENQDG
jgi:predicted DNA-binding protein (MmcQ/YjbR family)